jgi:hypothetical protein
MSPLAFVVIVIVVVAAMVVTQWLRRRKAHETATALGSGIGTPNPALPPALAPDHRSGIVTSGPPVELSVCGLPALVWQRSEHSANDFQPMRLSLIVDTAVGLPVLNLQHRNGMLGALDDRLADTRAASGIPALDDAYRFAGDLPSWAPVLATPAVQQALLGFPLDSLAVMGGRITLCSRAGVHLDTETTSAIAQVAAALVQAIPAQLTSAADQWPEQRG